MGCCSWRSVLILLLFTTPAAAFESPFDRTKFSLGYHFSTGSYGGSSNTEIAYIPLTARVDLGFWSAQLIVPYLRIDGPPGTVNGPSGPVQTSDGSADGLGDILTRASYTVLPQVDWMPFVELIGRIKFPTASRADGLGSGEFDYGIEAEFSKSFAGVTPFATVGYRILGSPPESDYRNVIVAGAGAMYQIFDSLSLGCLLDYRDAAAAGSGTRLEIIPFTSWNLTRHWSVDLYAAAGLATGSPDAGTGLQISWSL